MLDAVVYLLIPTSNHNRHLSDLSLQVLYIFWFLHQTTTHGPNSVRVAGLYIFWFLHQTTTLLAAMIAMACCISFDSYIKPQLLTYPRFLRQRCISFDSYIKPQHCKLHIYIRIVVYLLIPTSNHNPQASACWNRSVVYLLIPTSNHNLLPPVITCGMLYIFWFLHQTTTLRNCVFTDSKLYIFWFLHQTTTTRKAISLPESCISFDSYIKPQRYEVLCISFYVVYLLIPTSNHNSCNGWCSWKAVVYLLIPTSNHNLF